MPARLPCRALALVALVGLAACGPAPMPAAPSPTAPAPGPSSTPFLAATVESLSLIAGRAPGQWTAVGLLHNRSPFAVGSVSLQVSLIGVDGQALATAVVPTDLPDLTPNEVSPFAAAFSGIAAPSSARAEVAAYRPSDLPGAAILVGSLQAAATPDGGAAVIGLLTNPGARGVAVRAVVVLARYADGRVAGRGLRQAGLTYLDAGQAAPFLAVMDAGPAPAALTAYVDATPIEPPPASTIRLGSTRLAETAQGLPFVVGALQNVGSAPATAGLVVSLRLGGEVVGLAEVVLPLPLAPGEQRLFAAADFPGLQARLAPAQADALQAEATLDPLASAAAGAAPARLDLELTSFEAIGSSLFLKGTVANRSAAAVTQAWVLASVRSTEGRPLTAGWTQAAPRLAPGEQAEFTLALPLPRGADPATAEYDLLAAGLPG